MLDLPQQMGPQELYHPATNGILSLRMASSIATTKNLFFQRHVVSFIVSSAMLVFHTVHTSKLSISAYGTSLLASELSHHGGR